MASPLLFKVRRSKAVVVQPARPTPAEVKSLSDWDYEGNMFLKPVSVVLLFNHSGGMSTRDEDKKDPAEMIKSALAEALVYYYPWAGRLKEGPDGKPVVDCTTTEGVVFVEADADFKLDQLGEDSLQPPFPWIKEFLYSNNDLNSTEAMELGIGVPLFSMQVTRLLCGGFILTFTFDHVISDAFGAAQFLNAIAELACGAPTPSVLPIWQREELLKARHSAPPATLNIADKPRSDKTHTPAPPEGQGGEVNGTHGTFFFGPKEVAQIRARCPERLQESCTTFELIVACVLHCRVITLQHAPEEQVRVGFPVNCRNKFVDHPIPAGYYGNVTFPAILVCPMQDLHDLGCAVEIVKKAKDAMNEDYVRSMLDASDFGIRSPDPNSSHGCATYFFNDWSRVGFSAIDLGTWGKPIFVGNPYNGTFIHSRNFMVSFTNKKGEKGRLLNLYMSEDAMVRFSTALRTFVGSY